MFGQDARVDIEVRGVTWKQGISAEVLGVDLSIFSLDHFKETLRVRLLTTWVGNL